MIILQEKQVIFGRWEIISATDAGGQSFAYEGQDLEADKSRPWDRYVFIKQYHDLIPQSPEAKRVFQHFQVIRHRLKENSNYVCLPRHIGEVNNSVVTIYQNVKGSTLRDWMNRGITQEQSLRLAHAITNAVRVLHKAGVVHLDLKPENIMVKESGRDRRLFVQLIDLDSARIDNHGMREQIMGTPMYMSPEHIWPARFGEVSEKSDVFTLGIMLFELLFKMYPFDETPSRYEDAVAEGEYSIPGNCAYHFEVVQRIIRCLEPNPEKRPKAGWIHSTLHNHHSKGLEASKESERWHREDLGRKKAKLAGVRLKSKTGGNFVRVYYDSILIGRQELRGVGIGSLPSDLLDIKFTRNACVIELLTDWSVSVDGKVMKIGFPRAVSSKASLRISDRVLMLECLYE